MANVLNKITLQYKKSVHTPDYLDGNWIINPILPDCEKKYWKIVGEQVLEMSDQEKIDYDNSHVIPIVKTKLDILIDIWKNIENPSQKVRLKKALANNPFFLIHLEFNDFGSAINSMRDSLNDGDITPDDFAMIENVIPYESGE